MSKGTLDKEQGQYQHQADATLSQANPVSGTKYTVLDTTKNCKVRSIVVTVTWTVQPDPLEVHVTIDGVAITFVVANPQSATNYYASLSPSSTPTTEALVLVASLTTYGTIMIPHALEGRSVKVEVETTGGTTSNISAKVKYARRAF